ncbi:MAG: chromosomal replication initiator protein DnaA [Verrucomicrobiota bacterium]
MSENTSLPSQTLEPDFWFCVCEKLVKTLGGDIVDRWLADAVARLEGEDEVVLTLPSLMHSMWTDTFYRKDVEKEIEGLLGRKVELRLDSEEISELDDDTEFSFIQQMEDDAKVEARNAEAKPAAAEVSDETREAAGLNPKFSFETFVPGDNSRYAHAAAQAVGDNPGNCYNPLMFYGGPGMGKTHLMSAIGHAILERYPKKRVLFVTGEQFTNEFISALQRGAITNFRERFREVDVLLVDDIHFVAGKDSTQEEFFHTFNALTNRQGQVVLTSDRPPGEIPRLEKRLVSRFQSGIAAEILPPGVETRMAILQQKAEDLRIELDRPLIEFLAERIRKNVRRLEGALLRLTSYTSLYGGDVTVARAEEYLKDILMEEASSGIVAMGDVQKKVAEYFDLRIADLNGRRRTKQIALPRQIAMFLARELTDASLKEIGYAFGGRDHGTVIHACKQVNKKIEDKPETRRVVEFLKDQLTQ